MSLVGIHVPLRIYRRTIVPRPGMALLFQHMVNHAGTRVTARTKYVLRSDVLYRE